MDRHTRDLSTLVDRPCINIITPSRTHVMAVARYIYLNGTQGQHSRLVEQILGFILAFIFSRYYVYLARHRRALPLFEKQQQAEI